MLNNSQKVKERIEELLDLTDSAREAFCRGVLHYLSDSPDDFLVDLAGLKTMEERSGDLRRGIEESLYSQSFFLRFRGDIVRLLELIDHTITDMSNALEQFEIENPYIPQELRAGYGELVEISCRAVQQFIPAGKSYLSHPGNVSPLLQKVYVFQKRADKLSQSIKRYVFHEMDSLKLSQKIHLRYFALHIENIALAARNSADQLSVMAVKNADSSEIDPEEKKRAYRELEESMMKRMSIPDDMDNFYADAMDVQKEFSARLAASYPALSSSDRKLLTMLRLDFSTKDISSMLNIEPKSVEVARYRIRKKLGLKRSDNLIQFIKTI